MSSYSTDCDSAVRNSALALLYDTTVDAKSSLAIERAINHLLSIVQGAIAEFAHDWNEKRSPTTWETLPAETKLHCLSFLAPRQRVKMLLISRSVQEFMLSHPSLWTDIALPYFWEDSHDEFLRMMVARSGARELRIVWPHDWDTSDELPEPPHTTILNALHRITELTLNPSYFSTTPQRFQAAPVLRRLSVTEPVNIHPSVWNRDMMPQLRDLRLNLFTLCATPSSMDTVVRFEGTLWATGRSHWSHIWTWFPRLETLVLYNFVQDYDDPTGPPPASLRCVVLHTDDESNLEPEVESLVVDAWAGHGIRRLHIYCDTDTALRDGIRFLLRAESGMWSAQIRSAHRRNYPRDCAAILTGNNATVALIANAQSHVEQLKLAGEWSLFDQLEALTLHSTMMGTVLSIDLSLPALISLTIVNDWDGLSEVGWPFAMSRRNYFFPALREVTLDLTLPLDSYCMDIAARKISRILTLCLEHQSRLLDRIAILLTDDWSSPPHGVEIAIERLNHLTSSVQTVYKEPDEPLFEFSDDDVSLPDV